MQFINKLRGSICIATKQLGFDHHWKRHAHPEGTASLQVAFCSRVAEPEPKQASLLARCERPNSTLVSDNMLSFLSSL